MHLKRASMRHYFFLFAPIFLIYVISINPQNHQMISAYWVHKNIRIEDNTFTVYDSPILSARSTNGLYFTKNKIELTDFLSASGAKPAINLLGCTGVRISNNLFSKSVGPTVEIKKMKKTDIKSDIPFVIKTD